MEKSVQNGPFLWVALDSLVEDELGTFAVMDTLEKVEGDFGFKVGGDYLLKRSAKDARARLSSRPAFADIKMWSSADVMERSLHILHDAGFEATNAYALAGGYDREGGDELKRAITAFREHHTGSRLRIYALTVLTHYSNTYSKRQFSRELHWQVRAMVGEGIAAGAVGVIVPGTTLSSVDDLLLRGAHSSILKIIPGIRRAGEVNDDRQKQVIRPEDIAGRTDVEAVVGEPIMGSSDSKSALEQMLKALQG
ncbi:hypothetical protein A2673_02230 [Candidatus Kaiserbacteria bacterium RIFCSPHIGHO2_01_FULL_50_13]|uniref:Orotidine 5'-phosphate decarboxylase domain-containing protein n=1 Tax=Candidatus Kaiserbacteria bacterium RIFCSPLOWO2_01_FULL_50_24 TaxID=1798507 RepID=A0A1F6ER39_9BACT|nr:MAG: hypothetical protein A2673_02230 [Candidatus Kaiserbacteria bacterium RIFCSPHIGHO2_01_FULL_50_13]OGG76098.1 MAG: hypothetical protein A3A34_00735 [Candidatus Kaiserbacteria bacterium RIFCSPLOWO2_01_FULL_50_24]OGG82370.1 MAG: hypothetical protein A3H74_00180 [Candidatus Kaiserbacteria bacterium RIFCSPLOWO2_02_FULL_51_13]